MKYLQRMIVGIVQLAGLMALAAFSGAASANAPQCYPYSGAWYCQYTGLVAQAYVNSSDQIILYFDTAIDPATLSAVGATGVTVYSAATYTASANQNFGSRLYASLLSAQARGANVTIQMWGVAGGFLTIDRVWVTQ
jgi:hypothetical protein